MSFLLDHKHIVGQQINELVRQQTAARNREQLRLIKKIDNWLAETPVGANLTEAENWSKTTPLTFGVIKQYFDEFSFDKTKLVEWDLEYREWGDSHDGKY